MDTIETIGMIFWVYVLLPYTVGGVLWIVVIMAHIMRKKMRR